MRDTLHSPDEKMTEQRMAGRELDAIIAERVMGWTLTSPVDPSCDFSVGLTRDGRSARVNWGRTPNGADKPLPQYSTDIAAAFQVVDSLLARGWYPDLISSFDASENRVVWRCVIDAYSEPDTDQWPVSAIAFTPALAICLASLKALDASPSSVSEPA